MTATDAPLSSVVPAGLAARGGELLGISVSGAGAGDFEDLAGLALRDNPRRAHLIVSRVLGKHTPADPREVLGNGHRLADAVIAAAPAAGGPGSLVVGFCETATGLGHAVAQRLEVDYLHSTRRPVPHLPVAIGFEEEHSHAVSHLLQPARAALLTGSGPLVLVDDELTTGRTALNTIEALQALNPRSEYVLAVLVDTRTPEQVSDFEVRAAQLGVRVTAVSLLSVQLDLPVDILDRARIAIQDLPAPAGTPGGAPAVVRMHDGWWPAGAAATARHGMTPAETADLVRVADVMGDRLADEIVAADSVLVVGTEELMFLPTLVAARLADRLPASEVRFQSTTRSPVHASDDPGYAVRRSLSFDAPDEPGRLSRLHNVVDPAAPSTPERPWSELRHDHVVVVVDSPADQCAALVEALRPYAGVVHVVSLATGHFGSYPVGDVTWLLTDLSTVALERGTEDREEAIQNGVHYSEMLPVEFRPDDAYLALFHEALALTADRLAVAVGIVGELLWERHAALGQVPVLVSLARAGTPIGVLLRRYYAATRSVEVPHYTISIIRGRGIDEVALQHILDRHPATAVAFVDGWTGKGAIQRQLNAAVTEWTAAHPEDARLDPELAVLADPGGCTSLHGTRADFLIPSACLNSTVSGLVSRTVHRTDLIGPGMFHGAKFYAELADEDVSELFVDTVAGRFDAARSAIESGLQLPAAERAATWAGHESILAIAAAHGITDINLIKPGVGETTRVLLRRVPWKVLVRPDRTEELRHVLALAGARDVEVIEVPDLPYSCVGLIKQVV